MTQRLVSAPCSPAFSLAQPQILGDFFGGAGRRVTLLSFPSNLCHKFPPGSLLGTAHMALVSSNALEERGKVQRKKGNESRQGEKKSPA